MRSNPVKGELMLLLALGSTRHGKIPKRIFSTTGYDSQFHRFVAGAVELVVTGFEQAERSSTPINAIAYFASAWPQTTATLPVCFLILIFLILNLSGPF